ncbi:MAG TPA: FAD-dependent oxidoreductase [Candidatus Saccharimonadales bacterium]|nr:FAD-dependent oxidoreductase [Candidatus Saccharimonadales bacterium]
MFLLSTAIGGGLWQYHRSGHAPSSYDVVVVGAGPGGIAASIQAARMGAHVALLEETDWVGGQMTAAGVGSMDEGSLAARNSGLYKEFVQNVMAYYGAQHKSVDTCYGGASSICVDPKDGQIILRRMLDKESGRLQVYTGTHVSAVIKRGSVVTGVVANNKQFTSKVVIDADEYGDILAKAGAAYRLGNGTSDNPAAQACVQDITFAAVIKKYPGGVPKQLQFKQPPPGYSQELVKHFAALLQQNGYPAQLRPNGLSLTRRSPEAFSSYIVFRGLPDLSNPNNYDVFQKDGHSITRTSLNLGNDFPLKGQLSTKYISDPAVRLQSTCQAKLLTLQFVYYIQHDMQETSWSIANDEGYNTPYNQGQHCAGLIGYEAFEDQMSQEPYVREGRRLIGTQTLTSGQLAVSWRDEKHIPTYADSVAVGYYPMDIHECRAPNTLEPGLDTASDIPSTHKGGAFEVPLGVLIPQTVDGLLAAEKNISVSRGANGAIREQPITMDIGQAAGALAALSTKNHTQPRRISAGSVQSALQSSGVVTTISNKVGKL